MIRKIALIFFGYVLWPAAAFGTVYRCTDLFFRAKMIPYPFEWCGVSAGTGAFLWALALAVLIGTRVNRDAVRNVKGSPDRTAKDIS